MNLTEKVVWVTGGARMGEAVATALADRGCRIALSYRRSKNAAEETARRLQRRGQRARAFRCDVESEREIRATLVAIERHYGSLSGLVHLASIYEASKTPTLRSLDRHWAANARSAYAVSLASVPLLRRQNGGRIVHVADWTSASGRPRYRDYAGYYISKAAVEGIVEALALQLAPHILVNAIAPGPVLPPRDLSAEETLAVRRSTPLARWGGAEEIAKAACFLMETDFMTGETIRVDGGRHLL